MSSSRAKPVNPEIQQQLWTLLGSDMSFSCGWPEEGMSGSVSEGFYGPSRSLKGVRFFFFSFLCASSCIRMIFIHQLASSTSPDQTRHLMLSLLDFSFV